MTTGIVDALKALDNKLSSKYSTAINANSETSDFWIYFPTPIQLDKSLNYELGVSWFTVANTIYNVTNENNKYSVEIDEIVVQGAREILTGKSKTRKVFKECSIPPGAYELIKIGEEINKTINELIKSENKSVKDLQVLFELKADLTASKSIMTTKYPIKFSKGISDILGFESDVVYSPNSSDGAPIKHISKNIVMISRTASINIECNIIEGSYLNGKQSQIIYSFPTNTVMFGFKIRERMNPPMYFPVSTKEISKIRIRILDQNENLISFNGELITICLHLRQV